MPVETIPITMILRPYSPNGKYYNTPQKKEVIRSWKKTVGRPRLRWGDIRRLIAAAECKAIEENNRE
jgi:hypothetical protein